MVDPDWHALARRGVMAVDVALTKTNFLRQSGVRAESARIAQLRRALYQPLHGRAIRSRQEVTAVANQVARLASRHAGLRPTATLLEFTAAAAGGLDNYSAFLSGDQLKEIYSQIEGNFVGLGVELKGRDSVGLEIVHVIPDSPAARANIQAGDLITEIDGHSISKMSVDQAAGLLTGEEGSLVRVRVVPPHVVAKGEVVAASTQAARSPFDATIRREHVEVPSLEGIDIVDPAYGLPMSACRCFRSRLAATWNRRCGICTPKGCGA